MNRIKQLRKDLNWSQQKLADQLKVHQTAVSQWESGSATPSFKLVNEMCDIFDVDLGYLMGFSEIRGHFHLTEDDIEELSRFVIQDEYPNPTARIATALNKLNDDGQQKAVERVEELTEIPKYQKPPE